MALRFLIQEDVVIIPKSTNEERIKENFDLFDFELTEEEMGQLRTLDDGTRLCPSAGNENHPLYPF